MLVFGIDDRQDNCEYDFFHNGEALCDITRVCRPRLKDLDLWNHHFYYSTSKLLCGDK